MKKKKSLWNIFLIPILIIVFVQGAVPFLTLIFSGIRSNMENAVIGLDSHTVENRKVVLENDMIEQWSSEMCIRDRIYGLKSGKTYYVKVRAIAQGGGKKVTGKYSKAVKFTTYVVPKVKKISVKNNKKGTITITASKVKGAAGYAFVVTADSGLTDIVAIKESKKNTVTIKNLSKGHTYYIRACAYKLNKQKQKVFGVYTKKAKITIKK